MNILIPSKTTLKRSVQMNHFMRQPKNYNGSLKLSE
jgi:hypothetical protein